MPHLYADIAAYSPCSIWVILSSGDPSAAMSLFGLKADTGNMDPSGSRITLWLTVTIKWCL